MRTCLTLFVLGFASSAASASPSAEGALAADQLELGRRRDLLDDQPVDPYVRYASFGQLTGGGDGGGGAAAGAALAVGGLGCDIISGSAQGRLRPFARDERVTGQVDYSACLSRVLLTVAFSGTRGIGLAPSISDRRSLWSRRYAAAYDSVEIGFGELWDDRKVDAAHHTVLPLVFGHGETTQVDGAETRTIVTLDLDLAVYRYRQPATGLTVDTIVLTSNALKAGDDNLGGIASAFFPVRMSYEANDIYVRGAVGWGFTGGEVTQSGSTQVNGETVSSWTETIDGEGLPRMTILVGNVEAGVKQDRWTASGGVSRSFYPTFDGNIAREARIQGQLAYVAGRTRRTQLSLAPFATRTHTWTRDTGDSRDVSTGASLHVGRELSKQLRVDAIGEAGVSPYARLDGDRLPAGNVGGQVLVAVSAKVTDFTGHLSPR